MKVAPSLIVFLLATLPLVAADWPRRPVAVQTLIDQAMAENLALRSQAIDVEQALVRLLEPDKPVFKTMDHLLGQPRNVKGDVLCAISSLDNAMLK